MLIKKGDKVVIISGKDKGKEGKVIKALPRQDKIVVEGVNMKNKHQRPKSTKQKGQILQFAAPVHVSNVAMKDPKSGKPTRIGVVIEGEKKIRIARKSGTKI